jgi:hypothetical protein
VNSLYGEQSAWPTRLHVQTLDSGVKIYTLRFDAANTVLDDDNYESAWKAFCLFPAMVTQKTDKETKEVLKTRLLALLDCTEVYWGSRLGEGLGTAQAETRPKGQG